MNVLVVYWCSCCAHPRNNIYFFAMWYLRRHLTPKKLALVLSRTSITEWKPLYIKQRVSNPQMRISIVMKSLEKPESSLLVALVTQYFYCQLTRVILICENGYVRCLSFEYRWFYKMIKLSEREGTENIQREDAPYSDNCLYSSI